MYSEILDARKIVDCKNFYIIFSTCDGRCETSRSEIRPVLRFKPTAIVIPETPLYIVFLYIFND